MVLLLISLIITTYFASSAVSAQCSRRSSDATQCGIHGEPRDPYSFYDPFYFGKPQIVSSVEECAFLCSRREANAYFNQVNIYYVPDQQWCASFGFDKTSGLCQLAGQDPDPHYVRRNSSSTLVFYRHDCFDCGDICHQPIKSQLLDNGDFQRERLGPWDSFQGRLVHGGLDSSKSWRCELDACSIAQNFNKCWGKLYAMQLHYKEAPNSTQENAISMDSFTGYTGISPGWEAKGTGSTHWKNGTMFLRMPPKNPDFFVDPLEISSYTLNSKGFMVDKVRAFRIDTNPAIKHGAKSVIANGDFETGKLAPWKTNVTHHRGVKFAITSPGINSDYALMFYANGVGEGLLQQSFTTKPETAYLFTMDLRYEDVNSLSSYLYVFAIIKSQTDSVSYNIVRKAGDTSLSIPFIARDKVTTLQVEVRGSDALFDNFSLTQLAESPV